MRKASEGTEVPERSTKRGRGKAKHNDSRARESRAQVDRAVEHDRVMEDKPYVQPTSLEAPAARPGYGQRWVHVGVEGRWDQKNWARKQRDGWVPRQTSTVAKSFQVPRIDTGRFAGCIGVEGMVLCEKPLGEIKKRREFYKAKRVKTTNAVNDDIRRVNRQAGGGFGPIRKAETSQLVREQTNARAAGAEADIEL
jgi:hypothetical protein